MNGQLWHPWNDDFVLPLGSYLITDGIRISTARYINNAGFTGFSGITTLNGLVKPGQIRYYIRVEELFEYLEED